MFYRFEFNYILFIISLIIHFYNINCNSIGNKLVNFLCENNYIFKCTTKNTESTNDLFILIFIFA